MARRVFRFDPRLALAAFLALGIATPCLAQEPNFAPSSCGAGKLPRYPQNFGRGVRTHYIFSYGLDRDIERIPVAKRDMSVVIEIKKAADARVAVAASKLPDIIGRDPRYDPVGISQDAVGVSSGYEVSVDAKAYAHSAQELDREFAALCTIFSEYGYDILDLQIRTDEEEYALQRREALDFRRWGHAFLLNIHEEEVEIFLRGDWKTLGFDFFQIPTAFSRIRERDFNCGYVDADDPLEDHVHCEIGVLATSAAGPEYARGTMDFVRNRDRAKGPIGMLMIWQESLANILVN
ncbi:hypothetical protein HZY97_07985 [Sphingomonas sp. R-74633]|uniref:hypothetical protein n=1 Tax=Sphingomonas sp. R-74633 TaxID=2751188 RepID=UPI0015D3FA4A|nr:hypothetical protein [Sphingomonas sp. R-74633]NYT40692.1 hypothetical protein [Sphingomonas sp. R-74633]